MRAIQRLLMVFGLVAGFTCLFAFRVEAHGTAHRVVRDGTAVTVESFYTDKEPLQYAEVLVFSPSDRKVEYQNGRTDRNGRFAFFPDRQGTWRMEVSDGMGHRMTADIEVTAPAEPDTGSGSGSAGEGETQPGDSVPLKAAFGVSLIANAALVFHFLKTGKKRPRPAS
jgi:nickel transport protein